jgi:membrane protein YqaA with SNARE-associated domain
VRLARVCGCIYPQTLSSFRTSHTVLRKLYDWTLRLAARPNALRALAVVSFAESSFFPIPPDVMLIPMVIARRTHAWLIAGVCTIASVLGALLGYAIGLFLFETVGTWVIQVYGLQQQVEQFQGMYDKYGLFAVLIGGLTPIPYKLVTIMSGAAHFDLLTFLLASMVARGGRFYLVAALLRQYGEPISRFIEKRLNLLFVIFLICLIGGFAVLKYL